MAVTVSAPVAVAVRRPAYIGLSVLMAIIAIVGFWPRYFGPLVRGTLVQPLLIHVHAAVFTGWLVVERRRMDRVHQRAGRLQG
jgi:hypothetical protein